jgi:hypothetical protein
LRALKINPKKMRTSVLMLLILFAVASTAGFSQSVKVPKATLDAFAKDFPKAQKPHWQKGTFGFGFGVTFTADTLKNTAFYDQFGQLLEHTIFLRAELLPEAVRNTLSAGHPQAEIGQVTWVRSIERTFYCIELQKENRTFELNLDEDGKLIDDFDADGMPMIGE